MCICKALRYLWLVCVQYFSFLVFPHFVPPTASVLSLQVQQSVRPRYMRGYDINGRMRALLVDWLIQVHSRFQLLQETLYMTVAVLDRFLQVTFTAVCFFLVHAIPEFLCFKMLYFLKDNLVSLMSE